MKDEYDFSKAEYANPQQAAVSFQKENAELKARIAELQESNKVLVEALGIAEVVIANAEVFDPRWHEYLLSK